MNCKIEWLSNLLRCNVHNLSICETLDKIGEIWDKL